MIFRGPSGFKGLRSASVNFSLYYVWGAVALVKGTSVFELADSRWSPHDAEFLITVGRSEWNVGAESYSVPSICDSRSCVCVWGGGGNKQKKWQSRGIHYQRRHISVCLWAVLTTGIFQSHGIPSPDENFSVGVSFCCYLIYHILRLFIRGFSVSSQFFSWFDIKSGKHWP
jgi:hypothetical protein